MQVRDVMKVASGIDEQIFTAYLYDDLDLLVLGQAELLDMPPEIGVKNRLEEIMGTVKKEKLFL